MSEARGASLDFSGQVAIVTGGSRGIGQAVAEAFARAGARVVIVSRGDASPAVSALTSQGLLVEAVRCDLTNEDQVQSMINGVASRHGRIDILVNNAAINQAKRKIEEISLADWNQVIAANLTSQFLCCRAVTPWMKKRHRGKIVNVSSIAGRFRSALSGIHYVSSKAAILGFSRQLACELAEFNINVNAVCPSQTQTAMLAASMSPEQEEKIKAGIPLGRIATVAEQANVILFLASDLASYMTGAVVDVNGGQW